MTSRRVVCVILVCDECRLDYRDPEYEYLRHFDNIEEARGAARDEENWHSDGVDQDWCPDCAVADHGFVADEFTVELCVRCGFLLAEHEEQIGS